MTRLLLLVASTAVALGLAEATARALDPEWRLFYPPICFRPDLFEQTAWGYRLHPSRTLRLHPPRSGRAQEIVVSNAQGFRGTRDLDEADGRTRIVVLGDSMMFGPGVAEAALVTARLEGAEPGWRADNLGMVGYGPDLMLRALEAVGLDPPPSAVVLAVYADDLRRLAPLYAGVGFPIPRFALNADGGLETVPYPRPRPWERLRLAQGLAYARWRYTAAARPLTQALLARWQDLAAEHGFAPALVFVPRARERFDDRRWRRWFAAWAADAHVPYLDLTDALAAHTPDRLYLPRDSHWSAEGHAVVADALRPFVARALGGRYEAGRQRPRERTSSAASRQPIHRRSGVPDAHEVQRVTQLREPHLAQLLDDAPAGPASPRSVEISSHAWTTHRRSATAPRV